MTITPQARQNILFFGGIGVAGIAVYKLLQKIGLIKSAQDEKDEAAVNNLTTGAGANPTKLDPKNPALSFNPLYWVAILNKWKKDHKKTSLTLGELNMLLNPNPQTGISYNINLAKQADFIYNAKSTWWLPDQETQAMAGFRSLRNQAQISKLSQIFVDTFKIDLLAYIQSFMNASQLAEVAKIVNQKPLI